MLAPCQHCGAQLAVGAVACFRCGRLVARAEDAGTGAGTGASAVVSPTQLGTLGRTELLENQWRLVKPLGQGAVGEVWQAQDVTLDRPVAVKVMHAALAKDAAQVARFEREARILAGLEHPNLLPVLGIGRMGERPFLVTRLLEGKTLAEAMHQRGGKLSPAEAARVLGEICEALGCLHAAGVVHRDLKPSNVFIGNDRRVTLMDLGSALEAGSSLTRAGELPGTPGYLSPEQLAGSRDLDGKSDIYALGCLLFEALTGRQAFWGGPAQVLAAHAASSRPDAGPLGAPPALAALAQRAMAISASDRPTALALKAELLKFVPDEAPTSPFALPLKADPREPATQAVVFTPTTGNAAYPDERPPAIAAQPPAAVEVSLAGTPLDDPTVPRAVPLSVLITGGTPKEIAPRAPQLPLEAMAREFPTMVALPKVADRPRPLSNRAKAVLGSIGLGICAVVSGLLLKAPPPLAEPVRVDQPTVVAPVKRDEARVYVETKGLEVAPQAIVPSVPNLVERKEQSAVHERSTPDSRARKPNRTPAGFGKLRVTTTLDGNVVEVPLWILRTNKAGVTVPELKGRTPIVLDLWEHEQQLRVQYEDDPPINVPITPGPKKAWDKKGATPLEIELRPMPPPPSVSLGENTAQSVRRQMAQRAVSPMPGRSLRGRK